MLIDVIRTFVIMYSEAPSLRYVTHAIFQKLSNTDEEVVPSKRWLNIHNFCAQI